MKKVILSLGKGDLQRGFSTVTVQLWGENRQYLMKWEGSLPSDPELETLHKRWHKLYRLYYGDLCFLDNRNIIVEDECDTDEDDNRTRIFSEQEFRDTCWQLSQQLNHWLDADSFRALERQMRKHLYLTEDILVIIETEDPQLRQLPWHLWNFFEDYRQAEVALSLPNYYLPSPKKPNKEVKILGILGNCVTLDGKKIDVQKDKMLLAQLPGAKPEFLEEPNRQELNDKFWEHGWEILFFAGHSGTQPEDQTGRIYINQHPHDNSLTVNDLKNALHYAIEQGLRLAIFNSCDSLGLAWNLAQLNIPQIIAMREAVPDEVAQEFLKYFLTGFAVEGPEAISLHLAVRKARERLQGLEDKFPCASWLPAICQNPAVESPTWQEWIAVAEAPPKPPWWKPLRTILLSSLLFTGLVAGGRSLGLLQSSELQAFDQLMRLRPPEEPDERLLLVTVDEADIQYQEQQGMERKGTLSDQALSKLLEKLQPYHPRAIGLDIYHDFEFSAPLAAQLKQNQHFIGACEVGLDADTPVVIASPPGLSAEHLGFTDFPSDPDDVMRRQLLLMRSTPSCNTSQSLSLRITSNYLAQAGITANWHSDQQKLQLGNLVLRRFEPNAGGYQLPASQALGYQILINYRSGSTPFRTVSLRDLISNSLNSQLPDLIKDRIILIGAANDSKDVHRTPYSQGAWPKKMPGIAVHAHMISQILSAIKHQRPLLWWWPEWGEFLWIGSWSIVGSLLAWYWRDPLYWGLSVLAALSLLFALCFVFLLQGGWIPLVPSVLALVATSSCVVVYNHTQKKLSR